LIAYFLGNFFAKNYRNRTVYVKIIASCKGGTFFETQCTVLLWWHAVYFGHIATRRISVWTLNVGRESSAVCQLNSVEFFYHDLLQASDVTRILWDSQRNVQKCTDLDRRLTRNVRM